MTAKDKTGDQRQIRESSHSLREKADHSRKYLQENGTSKRSAERDGGNRDRLAMCWKRGACESLAAGSHETCSGRDGARSSDPIDNLLSLKAQMAMKSELFESTE